jgi:molybdopterin/thiamine biosynthesis adenylyltransferase
VTELSDAELQRYARHIVLREVGGAGQKKLKAARVAIIGAGGIGSAAIPAFAGAGIGRLTIIDDDVVDLSNLQRQPLFTEADVGEAKADKAAEFVRRLNRYVGTQPVRTRIAPDNADDLLAGHHLVFDGSDNFATRLAVSDACVRLGIPLVSAAAVMFQGQVGLFRSRPCYRCFVGDAFDSDDCDTCAEQGVLGAVTGTVGSFAALMAIRAIVAIGEDSAGAIHLFDGVGLNWRRIRIPADPGCKLCGSGR